MQTEAIIYARFSPRPDANMSTSNDRQEDRCNAYCERMGYKVISTYQDRNLSGGTFYERPGLQSALGKLNENTILVVDSVDRLARDQLVLALAKQQAKEAGSRIEYADGTPPATTPEGELVEGMLGVVAQFQRRVAQQKTKAGLARKREKGIVGGRTPIGYRRENGRLVEDETEQAAIAQIMYWLHWGKSIIGIVHVMDKNYGPIRGRAWSERTVRRIVKREMAKKELDNQNDN